MRSLLIVLSLLVFIACSDDRGAGTVNAPSSDKPDQSAPQPGAQPAPQPGEQPGAQPAEPVQQAPEPAVPPGTMSREECTAAGGTFRPSLGGQVECEPGETKLGEVAFGIEGGVCCQ
jgi:hypothetical protein